MPIPAHAVLLGGAPVAAAWTPASIPNLVAWYKADAGVTDAGGGAVSLWADQSGAGNDVAQGTGTFRPITGTRTINGLNVIDFDGSNDFLGRATYTQGTLSQPITLLAVHAPDATTDMVILDGFGAANRDHLAIASAKNRYYAGTVRDVGTAATGTQQWVCIFNGASSQLWINGTSISTLNPGTDTMIGLSMGIFNGAFGGYNGTMAEIVVANGSLSAGDRTAWNTYCARWGL